MLVYQRVLYDSGLTTRCDPAFSLMGHCGLCVMFFLAKGKCINKGFWPPYVNVFSTDYEKGVAKNRPKKCQIPAKTSIFVPFGAVHGFSRLVPDWFPTGSEFAESGVRFQFFGCQKNALFRAETGRNQTKPFPISRLFGNFPVGLTLRKGLKSAPFLRPKRIPKTEKKGAT